MTHSSSYSPGLIVSGDKDAKVTSERRYVPPEHGATDQYYRRERVGYNYFATFPDTDGQIWECHTCSALVNDTFSHDVWHQNNA